MKTRIFKRKNLSGIIILLTIIFYDKIYSFETINKYSEISKTQNTFIVENNILKIEFDEITIELPEVKSDNIANNSVTYIGNDTAIVDIEYDFTPVGIEGKIIIIKNTNLKNIKLFQGYETSITIMDEGPHLDLIDWKHYYSEWSELKSLNNNYYRINSYTYEESQKFIEINMEKLKDAVLIYGDDRWYDLVRESTSLTEYPCGVKISKIFIKISGEKEQNTLDKLIIFNIPMGC